MSTVDAMPHMISLEFLPNIKYITYVVYINNKEEDYIYWAPFLLR